MQPFKRKQHLPCCFVLPKLLALVLFVFLSSTIAAQKLYFNHLTVNSGLSQGVNNCIYRDSRGFVWISSYDGLNRFDGIQCRIFRPGNDSTGLQGTLFLNILEDAAGNVWVGSNQGLNKYDRKRDSFTNYTPQKALNTDKFFSPFYIDDVGDIWVQSGNKILVFNNLTHSFSNVTLPPAINGFTVRAANKRPYQKLQSIYLADKNEPVIWTGESDNEKFNWTPTKLLLHGSKMICFLPAGDSIKWFVGTNNGAYKISYTGAVAILKGTEHFSISTLYLDTQRTLWMGTLQNGLLNADANAWVIANAYTPNLLNDKSISGSQVQFVTTDNQQNLWVSLWGKGVDYTSLVKNRFDHYLTIDEVNAAGAGNFTRSMTPVHDLVWCGTQASGIIIIDSNKRIKDIIRDGLPPSNEHLLLHKNKVYVSTLSGLFAVDVTTHSVKKLLEGTAFASLQFNYAMVINSNELLLSANSGLYLLYIEANKEQIKKVSADNAVYLTTYRDKRGRYYLSEPFKGFSIAAMQQDSLQVLKKIHIDASVKCFYETDSVIWIGTTSGLVMFDAATEKIRKIFSVADGLSNQYIYGIIPSGKDLWISTNAGINRFNTHDYSVKAFTTRYGLQSNEFNTYAFCRSAQGEFLFGGVNGINGFYPQKLNKKLPAPQLALTALLINDSAFKVRGNFAEIDSLRLDPDQNTISLQFTAIDFSSPSEDVIRYMLTGYDKQWITAANKAFIRYARLPHGEYQLLVKAFNYDGTEAEKSYRMFITVATPWWQTWWFMLLIISVVTCIVVFAIRDYIRRKLLRQKLILEKDIAIEQERNRMAQDLHDGLGGMLSGIKHSLSAINIGSNKEIDRKDLLDKSINMLDSSIGELRRVAYNMMPESMLRFGIDATLRDYCYDLSGNSGVQVVFQSFGLDGWQPPQEVSIGIYRIVQELISNALRHAQPSQVIVQFIKNGTHLAITVEDNGIGFNTASLSSSKGMGWNNLQTRVASLKGNIDIQSETGKGTTVNVSMDVV